MTVTDIGEAQQRRDRIGLIADWVATNIPWTIAVSDWPGFSDCWPNLSSSELADIDAELRRRGEAICSKDADLDTIAKTLVGRRSVWARAATWLQQHPASGISDPEFVRLFGHISRAELLLAAIEHRRRLIGGLKS